ncbi:MAG: PAS domain-containing SpoIIE family protein phosphatase/ATP-binding protein [Actinomycetota bacterium]|nr:PAS domain-containing SpoIIE family protein phosphatase/ATP-binding protein [Actinomycetota bacterium]
MAIRPDVLAASDLLDALPMAVVLVDPTGVISGWNSAAETLYGHLGSDAVGEPFVDVLFDDDDRAAASALVNAAGRGIPWEGDFRVRRSDGALLVSSFRLAPVGAALGSAWLATDGIDQGLAEQERSVLLSAERAARATAEEALGLLEAILTSAPVGIAVFDLDLRYARVNDAYAALSGVPAEEHIGGQLGDVVPLQAGVAADLRRVVTTGRTILGRNVALVADEAGEPRSFNVSYFPVRSAAGALVGAGLTLVEVTEAKRAEAERAALLRRAEAAHLRLSILATASTVLTTTMELDELLARLTRVLTPMAADWCVIELVGRDGAIEHVAVSHRARDAAQDLAARLGATRIALDDDGPVAAVFRSGQARLAGPEAVPELEGREPPLHSSVVVPIESRGRMLGVLVLATEGDRQLDDDDLDLAVEIAHRAALAVGNARAFQQEHEIAESLQRALLPTTMPAVPGLELAVRYVAATDGASVGGDWYDVLTFDDGTTGIVVGDVIGHDIAASTSMGQLRSAIRIYAWEEHARPAAALARVDRLFDKLDLAYATCMFGVLDRTTSTFRWSNAGHPPPLLLRHGKATFLVEGNGVLLGVTGGAGMEEATTGLQEGDVLVLYTDGLVERRDEPLQAGLARLAAAAERSNASDPEVLCEALLEALVPPATTRDDDLAILVARVRADDPSPGVHRLAFELKPESAALTRGFTAGVLDGAGVRDQVDTAVLLVSELVTNAVRHARGPCALVVNVKDDEVELAVEDGDPQVPVTRDGGGLEESGRGLLLVGALADRWGVRAIPGGKAIWFSLRRHLPEE